MGCAREIARCVAGAPPPTMTPYMGDNVNAASFKPGRSGASCVLERHNFVETGVST